jgi:hypothetical protein
LVAVDRCREKDSKWHTGGVVPFAQCLIDFSVMQV